MKFDPDTGEVVEGAKACAECAANLDSRIEAERQLRAIERKLTIAYANEARLKTELEKQRLDTPEGRVAKAIGRYWITRCGKGVRTKVKDSRLKAIIARLREGYDPSYIARAIDGAAAAASTSEPETQRLALIKTLEEAIRRVDDSTAAELRALYKDAMRSAVVYDELELICRNEVKLESFYERAERVNAPTLVGPAWLQEIEGAQMTPADPGTPF